MLNQYVQDRIENNQTTVLLQNSLESYIDDWKQLYDKILEFLEDSDENCYNNEMHYQILLHMLCQKIEGDRDEIFQFLQIINYISKNHHRGKNFINKINKILQFYKDQIKQTLSDFEIFDIFENNKIILLFLLKNEIISISDTICTKIMGKYELNGNRYCYYFYPEIEKFIGKEEMKDVQKELLLIDENIFEYYDKKRQEGENDSYICTLIRQDSVEEFISYISRNNYSLTSKITASIFETNSFLIENNETTLIEYSAFFGSIQIFQYLIMNNVELNPILWLYVIHSKSAELIHILESNNVSQPKIIVDENKNVFFKKKIHQKNEYLKCYKESIKCHHNDISDYIKNNFFIQNECDLQHKEEIYSYYLKCDNFSHLQLDFVCEHGFLHLCSYNYNKLVNLILKNKEKEIESNSIKFLIKIFHDI